MTAEVGMSGAAERRPGGLELLLQALGRDVAWPGVGASAALVVALVAGMIKSVVAGSEGNWNEAGGTTAQAAALHRRALLLAEENAEAHAKARGALQADQDANNERERQLTDLRLGAALDLAADMPLQIVATAADAAELAAHVAEHCDPDSRADVVGAALLAGAAAAAAAHLVGVNLSTRPDSERLRKTRELETDAREAGRRALAASE